MKIMASSCLAPMASSCPMPTKWRLRHCSINPPNLADAPDVGRARRIEDSRGRYIHAIKASVPEHIRFDGLHVVLDCANGAAYQVAPTAIWELGAKVTPIGVSPNGKNINDKVGSTHVATLQETVVSSGADIGIALDGDADRLIVVDEKGRVVDGDQIMALARHRDEPAGQLTGDGIVATVMSNLGLERYLESQHSNLCGPRLATVMCWRKCAGTASMSAVSNQGI